MENTFLRVKSSNSLTESSFGPVDITPAADYGGIGRHHVGHRSVSGSGCRNGSYRHVFASVGGTRGHRPQKDRHEGLGPVGDWTDNLSSSFGGGAHHWQ